MASRDAFDAVSFGARTDRIPRKQGAVSAVGARFMMAFVAPMALRDANDAPFFEVAPHRAPEKQGAVSAVSEERMVAFVAPIAPVSGKIDGFKDPR